MLISASEWLAFVDLSIGAHLGLMFYLVLLLGFFIFYLYFFYGFVVFGSGFGVLTVREIGKRENGEEKIAKIELECLNLEFHVDLSQHLSCASTLKSSLLCSTCYSKLESKRLEMLFYRIVSNAY